MFKFKPKDDIFFELLKKGAVISNTAAKELRQLMNELDKPQERLESLSALEHEGDIVTHTLIEQTKKMFITPLDREDIFNLTKSIDNVTDDIEATANKFYMYNIVKPTPEAIEVLDKLVRATESLVVIASELKCMNKSNIIMEKILEVNTIENEADKIYRKAVKALFDNPTDIEFVLKWKDLYKYIEDSIDSCESLANEVRGVAMKYA